jgi:hypothetical protein
MKKTLSILLLALIANTAYGALVSHTGKYFAVTEHDRSYRVGRESLDGTLRNINKTNLVRFMQKGRISAHKLNDGGYMLRGHVNGLGSGPVLASFSYWCVKSLCWGGIATTGTALVVSGVGAGTALLGGGTIAGTLTGGAGAGVGLAMEAGLAVGTGGGTAVVAGALGNTAAGLALASEGTVALTVGGAGTSLGVVGFIEGLSLAAYAAALSLPTP